ncbi:hypothetical protein NM688_g4167 [Phlebia brevispora]|uniref:Uncharacterized protein n=1 Tax=Phlebia brevispora TaxID=194682 RepID=A0ACC1T3N4_9APHY|nr:hypothetical protein NM688_g4167 [Phlebia brevispora]
MLLDSYIYLRRVSRESPTTFLLPNGIETIDFTHVMAPVMLLMTLVAACVASTYLVYPSITTPPTPYTSRYNFTSHDLEANPEFGCAKWTPLMSPVVSAIDEAYRQVVGLPSFYSRDKIRILVEEFIWCFGPVVKDIETFEMDITRAVERPRWTLGIADIYVRAQVEQSRISASHPTDEHPDV